MIVLLVAFLLIYPLHVQVDLPFWDESNYVGQGWAVAKGVAGLPAWIDSPLYVLAYALLGKLLASPIQLVYAMIYLLGVLLPGLLFVLLNQRIQNPIIAAFLCIVYLFSEHQFGHTFTYLEGIPTLDTILVYRFGVMLFLAALIALQKSKLLTLLFMVLCVFVRQEYLLALIPYAIGIALQVIMAIKNKISLRSVVSALHYSSKLGNALFVFCAGIIAYIIFASPGLGSSSNRMWFAFQQHYAVDQVVQGNYAGINPWVEYSGVTRAVFPGALSVPEAMTSNPSAFFWHIWRNVRRMLPVLYAYVRPVLWTSPPIATVLFSLSAGLFLLGMLLSPPQKLWQALMGIAQTHKSLLFLNLCSMFTILPSLIILTKSSYSLALMPFLFLWLGWLMVLVTNHVRQLFGTNYVAHTLKLGPAVVSVLLVFTVIFGNRPFKNIAAKRPLFDYVQRLDQALPKQSVRLAGLAVSTYANYLGLERVTGIEMLENIAGGSDRKVHLQYIINEYKPNAILITPGLLASNQIDLKSLDILQIGWAKYRIGEDDLYMLKP